MHTHYDEWQDKHHAILIWDPTARHKRDQVSELSALKNRTIEFYEGATSEHRFTSSATQTEVQKPTVVDQGEAYAPEALIVKKTGEASYAEMLRKLRSEPKQTGQTCT